MNKPKPIANAWGQVMGTVVSEPFPIGGNLYWITANDGTEVYCGNNYTEGVKQLSEYLDNLRNKE